jgi:hypothetical protein
MNKTIVIAALIGLGWVSASQAVVISWSAETTGTSVPSYLSAQLVYVSGGVWGSYEKVGDLAVGSYAILSGGSGVREQDSVDTDRSQGSYYVVLFSDAGGTQEAYRSYQALAWNDTSWDAFTYEGMGPAEGLFTPAGAVGAGPTTGWQTIPEPNTFALLALGAAALAARRRRKL